MSLVRLLGFTTLSCGCVVGRYRELATSREITYVEEKGKTCGSHGHRRNHTVVGDRYNVRRGWSFHQGVVTSYSRAGSLPACTPAATMAVAIQHHFPDPITY